MWFLKSIELTAFGAFAERAVGPFGPGLNFVYGKNEAGKSSIAALIRGVLLGWPQSRGGKNSYKHSTGNRAGILVFEDALSEEKCIVSRTKKSDSLSCSSEHFLSQITVLDPSVLERLVFLNSSELLGFEQVQHFTDRLFATESQTEISPINAQASIDAAIRALTSKSQNTPDSLFHINARIQDNKNALQSLKQESQQAQEDLHKYQELKEKQEETLKRIASLKEEIQSTQHDISELTAINAQLEHAQNAYELQRERCEREQSAYNKLEQPLFASAQSEAQFYSGLSLRQKKLSELEMASELARQRMVSLISREHYVQDDTHTSKQKPAQKLKHMVVPLLCIGALVVSVLSLLTAHLPLGSVALVLLVLACVALIFIMLRTTHKQATTQQTDISQDLDFARIEYETCQSIEYDAREELDKWLAQFSNDTCYLSAQNAQESYKHSHELLREKLQAHARLQYEWKELEEVKHQLNVKENVKHEFLVAHNLTDDSLESLTTHRAHAEKQREHLLEELRSCEYALGQLQAKLSLLEHSHDLDEAQTRLTQLRSQQMDATSELCELIISKILLRDTLQEWKHDKVPSIYARASQLMQLFSNGVWETIKRSESGGIIAVNAFGKELTEERLSTSTRQQLYLALRLSMIELAPQTCGFLPLVADDILVHFDDERRSGVLKACAEIARTRQVIFFTCHKEILDQARKLNLSCSVVEL